MKGKAQFSASTENFNISWLQSPENSKKFTFKDILNYSGEGFLKVYFLLDSSDVEEVGQVLQKYRRKVWIVPIENVPIIDRKGRLQLSSKRSFSTESQGMGSFCQILQKRGHFLSLKSKGVKYVYLQPLTNLNSKLIDFDLLDIMLSTSQPGASSLYASQKKINASNTSVYYKVNNHQVTPPNLGKNNFLSPSLSKFTLSNHDSTLSDIMEQKVEYRDQSSRNQRNHLDSSRKRFGEGFPITSIQSFDDSSEEAIFDCISKIYDLEGDLALKVHDEPSDYLNSIKFFDPEVGTNWSKLHSGETVFNLDRFLSKKFAKKYNYCTFADFIFNFALSNNE